MTTEASDFQRQPLVPFRSAESSDIRDGLFLSTNRELSGAVPIESALQLSLVALVAMSGIYARAELGPLQESIRVALSLTDNQLAVLQGPALALPLLIAAFPLGIIIDRYSRKRLLVIATLTNCIATVLPSLWPSFLTLLACRCVIGIAAPATALAAYSLVSDLYVVSQRGRATMVVLLAQVFGSSGAFALGGHLLTAGDPNRWRYSLLVMGALLVPATALAMIIRDPPRMDLVIESTLRQGLRTRLSRYRSVIAVLTIGMTMANVADGAALVWTVPLLSRNFALPPSQTGAIMASILLAAGVLGPAIGGNLADICCRTGGTRRTISALIVLAAIGAAAGTFPMLRNVLSVVLSLGLFLVVGGALDAATTAVALVAVPNDLRGVAVAVKFAAGTFFGLGIAPISVSILADAFGGAGALADALAIVCGATSLFGLFSFALGRRHFRNSW